MLHPLGVPAHELLRVLEAVHVPAAPSTRSWNRVIRAIAVGAGLGPGPSKGALSHQRLLSAAEHGLQLVVQIFPPVWIPRFVGAHGCAPLPLPDVRPLPWREAERIGVWGTPNPHQRELRPLWTLPPEGFLALSALANLSRPLRLVKARGWSPCGILPGA